MSRRSRQQAPPVLPQIQLPERYVWTVDTAGTPRDVPPFDVRGAWLRWKQFDQVTLEADEITASTFRVHVTYGPRPNQAPRPPGPAGALMPVFMAAENPAPHRHRQLLGMVTRDERGYWTPSSETGSPVRAEAFRSLAEAAEALTKMSDPDHP